MDNEGVFSEEIWGVFEVVFGGVVNFIKFVDVK